MIAYLWLTEIPVLSVIGGAVVLIGVALVNCRRAKLPDFGEHLPATHFGE